MSDAQFRAAFGQSFWIIAGSITAFLASQLIDAVVFWAIRRRTGSGLIGLRATGSTVVSQLIDTFSVTGIAFWLPGRLSFTDFVITAGTGYTFKLAVAPLLTPAIYLGHHLAERFLGRQQSEDLIAQADPSTREDWEIGPGCETGPIVPHPSRRDIVYGSQYLHRTRDRGVTWERLSPDLTAKPEGCQGVSGEA